MARKRRVNSLAMCSWQLVSPADGGAWRACPLRGLAPHLVARGARRAVVVRMPGVRPGGRRGAPEVDRRDRVGDLVEPGLLDRDVLTPERHRLAVAVDHVESLPVDRDYRVRGPGGIDDPSRAQVQTWLLTIARNVLIDERRSARVRRQSGRRGAFPSAAAPPQGSTPSRKPSLHSSRFMSAHMLVATYDEAHLCFVDRYLFHWHINMRVRPYV